MEYAKEIAKKISKDIGKYDKTSFGEVIAAVGLSEKYSNGRLYWQLGIMRDTTNDAFSMSIDEFLSLIME